MSISTTRTVTFTATSARHLTSKIAADLRTMHRYYNAPGLTDIDEYAQEAAQLLLDGYLTCVDYGLRRPTASGGMEWVLQLRYTVSTSGTLTDNHPGGVPANAPSAGATFYSYLSYSQAFNDLPQWKRDAVKADLPVQRSGAAESPRAGGTVNGHRSYSRDGVSLSRDTFVAWEK
ncbi:MAG: hypothetical protein ABI662_03830 [Dermatophilaceae bacterium]|jgi:hypothetical protein